MNNPKPKLIEIYKLQGNIYTCNTTDAVGFFLAYDATNFCMSDDSN